MAIRTIKGNLLKLADEGNFDLIVHGCNCFCCMGGGIALQIKQMWPEVFQADCRTKSGDRSKMGTYSQCLVGTQGEDLVVINAYTQYDHNSSILQVDYDAIRNVLKTIVDNTCDSGTRIGLPLIGCGLAGGDWGVVKNIIEEELIGFDVTIVEYVAG